MNFTNITERINQSGPIEFGSIFNNSVQLFKKVWLQGFITLVLTMVSILPFYLLFYAPLISYGISDPNAFESEELPPAVGGIMILIMPIFMTAVMMVAICLNAGFLRICKKYDLNESGKDDYFYFFKKEYLGKAIIMSLIIFGLAIVGMLTCGLGLFYLMVPLSLFPAFFAFDKELSAIEIIKASFSLGHKNWLTLFLLILVSSLASQLGVVLCFIGFFFTVMFSKIPIYFVYKDTIGISMDV